MHEDVLVHGPQCRPWPHRLMRYSCRSAGVAFSSPGNRAIGTPSALPSVSATHTVSSSDNGNDQGHALAVRGHIRANRKLAKRPGATQRCDRIAVKAQQFPQDRIRIGARFRRRP